MGLKLPIVFGDALVLENNPDSRRFGHKAEYAVLCRVGKGLVGLPAAK
jgi:hypothetical protein